MGLNRYSNINDRTEIENIAIKLKMQLDDVNDEIAELAIGGDSFEHLVDTRVSLIESLQDAKEQASKFK